MEEAQGTKRDDWEVDHEVLDLGEGVRAEWAQASEGGLRWPALARGLTPTNCMPTTSWWLNARSMNVRLRSGQGKAWQSVCVAVACTFAINELELNQRLGIPATS